MIILTQGFFFFFFAAHESKVKGPSSCQSRFPHIFLFSLGLNFDEGDSMKEETDVFVLHSAVECSSGVVTEPASSSSHAL